MTGDEEAEADQARRNEIMPTDPDSRFLGLPMGSRPHGIDPNAFPGRPGDVPEPGPGDTPDRILPMNQIGQPLGRAAMEDARQLHKQLVALTVGKIGEVLGALAALNTTLQLAEGRIAEVEMHMVAATTLCAAAVGSVDGLPQAGRDMAAQLRLAARTVSAEENLLRSRVIGLRAVQKAMYQQLTIAGDRGRVYGASI